MAITLHGSPTSQPADNGAEAGPAVTWTPPGSMTAGMLTVVLHAYRGDTFLLPETLTTGGQDWRHYKGTANAALTAMVKACWCQFNGTWSANPVFVDEGGSGTAAMSAVGAVFAPSGAGKTWVVDPNGWVRTGTFTATGTTKTITGYTPTHASTVTIAWWFTTSATATTWSSLSGSGWTGLGQFRNTTGTDLSVYVAYKIQTTASALGDVSITQGTGTAGGWGVCTFAEIDTPAGGSGTVAHDESAGNQDAGDASTMATTMPSTINSGYNVAGYTYFETSNFTRVTAVAAGATPLHIIGVWDYYGYNQTWIAYCGMGITGTPQTITVTLDQNTRWKGQVTHTFAGAATFERCVGGPSPSLDDFNPGDHAMPSVTPSEDGAYIFSCIHSLGSTQTAPIYSPTSSWGTETVDMANAGDSNNLGGGYKVQTTAAAIAASWTQDLMRYSGIAAMVFVPSAATAYALTAAAGAYTLTGQAAGLLAARKVAAAAGSYALTGQAAGLLAARKVAADAGAYTLDGQAVGLLAARLLAAGAGAYVLTGQGAMLAALAAPDLWFKAGDLALADGAAVTSWADAAGGVALAQTLAARQPVYKVNIVNGHPVVRFDGGDCLFRSGSPLNGDTGGAIFVVFRTTTVPGSVKYLVSSPRDTSNVGFSLQVDAGPALASYSTTGSSPVLATGAVAYEDGAPHLARATFDASLGSNEHALYHNGALVDQQTNAAATLVLTQDEVNVGNFRDGAGGAYTGDIAEILAYDVALSGAQILQVETYLADKYGITLESGPAILTADAGSYVLTGQAAGLTAARLLVAEAGTYALDGQVVNLWKGRTLTADAGAYTLAGQAVSLLVTRLLGAEVGTYTVTGQDAGLLAAHQLAAGAGAYALTGQDAQFALARTILAAAGAYTLTGQDAALLRTALLTAGTGVYTLTGADAVFSVILTPQGVVVTVPTRSGTFVVPVRAVSFDAPERT